MAKTSGEKAAEKAAKEAADQAKASNSSKYEYIGPSYQKGLVWDGPGLLKPKGMTDVQIESMVAKHPKLKRLWKGLS